jgi:uncharacterized membrane protein
LNCDLVNRSTYSTVFGIPVALIGIIGYVALLALATLYRTKHEAPVMLLIASVAGLGLERSISLTSKPSCWQCGASYAYHR